MTTRPLKNKLYVLIIAILFLTAGFSTVLAGDFQDPPYDFKFGNHIDTHQETKLKVDKDDNPASLSGFLYIYFPDVDPDPVSGLPVARHPRGEDHDEVCGVDVDCVKGWDIKGVPSAAKFLYHSGVYGDDHPVWRISRLDIPQPGSYTHFHWITTTSTDGGASSVQPDCDKQKASQLETMAPDAINDICAGWLLEIKAKISFAFEHGGEKIPVRPGIDNASHLNIVTNYAAVPSIDDTE